MSDFCLHVRWPSFRERIKGQCRKSPVEWRVISRRVAGVISLDRGKLIFMKRTLTTAVVALSVLVAGAGTASAQDPYAKYPTESACRTAGFQYVLSGQAFRYECSGPHAGSSASQKWWLYLI